VTKQRDAITGQRSLLFEVHYPEISDEVQPRHRFMSAYEQRVEVADPRWQYLLFAAEPYETIAFKIPNRPIVRERDLPTSLRTRWDRDALVFSLHLHFVLDQLPTSDENQSDVTEAMNVGEEDTQHSPESEHAASNPLAPPSPSAAV
jgi:splicing factor 3A subunit 2